VVQIAILELHDLVESLLMYGPLGLLVCLVLALNDRPAYGALSLRVTLDASFQRHIEKDHCSRDLKLPSEVEQLIARQSR
jgi:hypothetical protein